MENSYYSVSEEPLSSRWFTLLSLGETRRFVAQSHARMMVVFFAILYALGSMVLGGMLTLVRVPGGYSETILTGGGAGAWNYPGFLLVAPWGVVSLPFLATWSMVIVSIGVGIGVSVALLISVRLLRDRRKAAAQPGSVGAVAGLTPAMIALVTLGACCSTTAAATAGVGLVAQTSGSTLNNLLVNNWYLDLFQVVVILIALLAQEMILEVYGGLFGLTPVAESDSVPATEPRPLTRREIVGGAARVALLVAGVTWSLAMFAEWTTVNPATAGATLWFQWLLQHQVLAVFAVLVALFPSSIARALTGAPGRAAPWALRGLLIVTGFSLAVWVPAPVAAGGASGFVNELFGALGLPAAWGSVAPIYPPGLSLYVRWGLDYLLLGGFALAVGLLPDRLLNPLRWNAAARPGRPSISDVGPSASRGTDRSPAPTALSEASRMRAGPAATARGVHEP